MQKVGTQGHLQCIKAWRFEQGFDLQNVPKIEKPKCSKCCQLLEPPKMSLTFGPQESSTTRRPCVHIALTKGVLEGCRQISTAPRSNSKVLSQTTPHIVPLCSIYCHTIMNKSGQVYTTVMNTHHFRTRVPFPKFGND